jgi:intracellular septation protein A
VKEGACVAEDKKLSGVVIGLMAFGPFVLYGFASGANHWRVATGGGLILCLVFIAVRLRHRIPVRLMDWTGLGFFAIASVLAIGLHSAAFPIYNVVVIWSCFAVAAWSSIAIGHPFTAAYARENTPPEFWVHPVFIRLNLVMTLVWCGLMTVNVGFAVTGVVIGGNFGKLVPGFALPTALLIAGFVFNSRFPARYLARAGDLGGGASPAVPG